MQASTSGRHADQRIARRRSFDWPSLKREYVEGVPRGDRIEYPTLREVAERCGARAELVRQRAAREQWRFEREQYRARVERERQDRRARAIGEQAAQFDADALRLAQGALVAVGRRLGAMLAEGRILDRAETSELQALASAMHNFYRVGRAAIDGSLERAGPDPASLIRPADAESAGGPRELVVTVIRGSDAIDPRDDDDD
jgi:hypothetical protein